MSTTTGSYCCCLRCLKKKMSSNNGPHRSPLTSPQSPINPDSLQPQRLQRSSHLGYKESTCITSDDDGTTNKLEELDIFCQGKRGLWSITNDISLEYQCISSRVVLEKEGISRYLICTCVSRLPQGCTGCFGIFRKRNEKSSPWNLAIVQSFFYLNHDGTDKIHLLQWTGKLAAFGSPAFYAAKTWDEISSHFRKRVFDLKEIDFFFINKVSGITFPNETISDDTRSTKDGGIQCNPNGPDQVPFTIPVDRLKNMNLNLSSLSISPDVQPFFKKNKLEGTSRQQVRKKRKSLNTPQSDMSRQWTKSRPRSRAQEATLCALFVSHPNGRSLEPDDLQSIGDASNLYFFPSPMDDDVHQEFYGISPDDYGNVRQLINGISREEAKNVLLQYSNTKHILFNASLQTTGHSYTKIFVDGTPSSTFSSANNTTTYHTPLRKVTCQTVPSDSYHELIPMSASVVDPKLHGHKVISSIIRRIELALGKKGIFTRRSRSGHENHLSFIGRRSEYTVAQATPSEGDPTSFWYYRQHINHCWWPLTLKVINSLTDGIQIFTQMEYFHLTILLPYLLPHLGSGGDLNFCLFAILTINFVNCIHTDTRDKMHDSVAQAAIEELQSLLHCKYLSVAQRRQVDSSLLHIKRYGVTTPTTCGYQIVRENEDNVEVLQFFCSYGLGTCHRIQQFWVHSFLPALYSHYTSAPLYIFNGKVFATYEGIDVLAWGKGEVKERGSFGVHRSKRNI